MDSRVDFNEVVLTEEDLKSLVNELSTNFSGWHFSNTNALSRTTLCVIPEKSGVGGELKEHLKNAIDLEASDTAYRDFIRMVYNSGKGLNSRGDAAMQVLGPAVVYVSDGCADSIPTRGEVEGFVVRMAAYDHIEGKIMAAIIRQFHKTLVKPRNPRCLAAILGSPAKLRALESNMTIEYLLTSTIDDCKTKHPKMASAFTSLMQAIVIQVIAFSDAGSKFRDKAASDTARQVQISTLQDIMYRF